MSYILISYQDNPGFNIAQSPFFKQIHGRWVFLKEKNDMRDKPTRGYDKYGREQPTILSTDVAHILIQTCTEEEFAMA